MGEIQSGRELCDGFFEALRNRKDVDQTLGMLLSRLYSEGKLAGREILEGLQAVRTEEDDGTENQT